MRKTFGIAAAAVLAFSVSACGDDGGSGGFDEAAYCDAYESAQSQLEGASFSEMNPATFSEIKTQVVELREKAPEDLTDEWNTLANAFDELEGALEDAGLTVDDLGSGQLPEGIEQEDIDQLQNRISEFAESNDLEGATTAIEQDAETRCDIPADGGSS